MTNMIGPPITETVAASADKSAIMASSGSVLAEAALAAMAYRKPAGRTSSLATSSNSAASIAREVARVSASVTKASALEPAIISALKAVMTASFLGSSSAPVAENPCTGMGAPSRTKLTLSAVASSPGT
ncbi:MAG: hypothetical protein WAU59_19925 [Rhodoplanes sp.]